LRSRPPSFIDVAIISSAVSSDFRNIEGRGISRQYRVRFADVIELRKDFLLQRHVLEYRLDDDVCLGYVGVIGAARDQCDALLCGILCHPPSLDPPFVLAAYGLESGIDRCLIDVENACRDTGVRECHCDTAAHGSGADDAAGRDVPRQAGIDAGNLRGLPLREKQAHHGFRFGRLQRRVAYLLFTRDPFGEGQIDRGLDRIYVHAGYLPVRHLRCNACALLSQECIDIIIARKHDLACSTRAFPVFEEFIGESDREFPQVSIGDRVEQAG
jgi:hypothetical protein